jgi:hypothetical protein
MYALLGSYETTWKAFLSWSRTESDRYGTIRRGKIKRKQIEISHCIGSGRKKFRNIG